MHSFSPILLAALLAAPGFAATPPAGEHRLTPAQIQQVLDDAAAQREASDRLIRALPTPEVHGELGVEIGTGGYRSAYGSAVLGIGRRGSAMVSFDSTRFNSRRRDHY